MVPLLIIIFFFFNDTATTEIYTLSLHDALPIYQDRPRPDRFHARCGAGLPPHLHRSEEHTSEFQSQSNLVCRLLLEKKKKMNMSTYNRTIQQLLVLLQTHFPLTLVRRMSSPQTP